MLETFEIQFGAFYLVSVYTQPYPYRTLRTTEKATPFVLELKLPLQRESHAYGITRGFLVSETLFKC